MSENKKLKFATENVWPNLKVSCYYRVLVEKSIEYWLRSL